MKSWIEIVKPWIMSYIAFLGCSIAGIAFGVIVFMFQYEVSSDWLTSQTIEMLKTPLPYIFAFSLTVVERAIILLKFYGTKKEETGPPIPTMELKLNNFLTVKFVQNNTVIYVKGEPFRICKYLLMNIPTEELNDYSSIDEASEFYGRQFEKELTPEDIGLTPEEEFKAHCSNLQVWVENNYDTCLLHRNLAFPLLKKLSSVGDPLAKEVFVREIIDRFKSRSTTVQTYLVNQGYLSFLEEKEVGELFEYIVDKDVFYRIGGFYENTVDLKSEIKVLNRIIEIDPINYNDLMVLANRYIKNNDILMAKLVLRKILMMYPNDEKSLFFLAHLYMFEGKIEKTKQVLKRLEGSELRFVRYKNLFELDGGMRKLLDSIKIGYYPDPYERLTNQLFEEWD